MDARKMAEGLHWVGAVDWDRRLFDALIPLPDGTSYNAYVVQGTEKTALLDTVDPAMTQVLLKRLDSLGLKRIDHIVAHHAEQDHSGSIPAVLERYPMAQVLCTPKCKPMLLDLLEFPEGRAEGSIRTMEDGESVDLGGRTLRFIHFPWVHWPETMLTWVPELKTLFPCDLFGSHYATNALFSSGSDSVLLGAKRYYAEIMMPFRAAIVKNRGRLAELDIRVIAPSHGPAYDDPSRILDAYKDWTAGPPKNLAVVAYISMHDSTRLMADHLVEALTGRGVAVERFDLEDSDIGKLAMSLVDAQTLILGTPTVIGGPHPAVAYAAVLANLLKPKARFAAVFGSYGWGGQAVETLAKLLPALKLELLPPVLAKGLPRGPEFKALDRLAEDIAARHSAPVRA
ncbi:MAG: FprA family A-type flavoprotein [Elusimicrobiota bacterium]